MFRALWHTIYIPVTKPLLVINKTWGGGNLFQSLLRLSTFWRDPWSMVVIQTTCINFLGLLYKLQQTWWLKKEFILSQVQRPRSLLRRCQQSWLLVEVLREGPFQLSLSFWGVLVVLGVPCGCLPVCHHLAVAFTSISECLLSLVRTHILTRFRFYPNAG